MPRALLIHGNPTQASTLSGVLRAAGVDVEVAAECDWAQGLIDARRFDLVITPGSEFARLIDRCAEESAQRQYTEGALLDAEAMYRSFAEGLPIHLVCKDRAGRFTFANGLFCRELGHPLHEIVGRTDYDFFSAELADKYCADDRRVIEGRQVFRDIEENRLPSGEVRHVEVIKAPVYNASGEVVGVQIAFWDVTDRKRSEEEIQRKNRDLETLLFVTSHDLREPLRAIHNFARLVSERCAPQLDESGRDFLRRVVRGAERLDRLLEDVLTLSRAQRSIEPSSDVALGPVVADVLQQLDARIEGSAATIRIDPDLPRLRGDRRWITQAVYNLVSNALKFTRGNETPQIDVVAYRPHAGEPTGRGLVVCDRGPGVPAGCGERIFQLFQRAVGREVEGTGAGLAIVRQIAEQHGGSAWHRAREGGGSEFVALFDRNGG
ncbi:MAG: sensor histidine kinase [Planctomycetaceae bacterium]